MTTYRSTADESMLVEVNPKGNPMLLEENLARSRMHDAEIFARQHRLATRELVAQVIANCQIAMRGVVLRR